MVGDDRSTDPAAQLRVALAQFTRDPVAVGAEDAEREAAWAEYYQENPDAVPGDESGDVPTGAPAAAAESADDSDVETDAVAEAEEAPVEA